MMEQLMATVDVNVIDVHFTLKLTFRLSNGPVVVKNLQWSGMSDELRREVLLSVGRIVSRYYGKEVDER